MAGRLPPPRAGGAAGPRPPPASSRPSRMASRRLWVASSTRRRRLRGITRGPPIMKSSPAPAPSVGFCIQDTATLVSTGDHITSRRSSTALAGETSDLRPALGPVGVSQLALDELARGVTREVHVDAHLARDLVVGHALARPRAQLIRGERRARPELDRPVHAPAPVR